MTATRLDLKRSAATGHRLLSTSALNHLTAIFGPAFPGTIPYPTPDIWGLCSYPNRLLRNGLFSIYSQGKPSLSNGPGAIPRGPFLPEPITQNILGPANPAFSQTLVVPAIVALLVFVIATYILLPLWRRYRSSRYGAYLPLDTLTTGTQSLRHRVQHHVARWLVPSTWRERIHDRLAVGAPGSDNGVGFDSDEGEELDEVPEDEEMRARLEREARRSRGGGRPDLQRRLSRE